MKEINVINSKNRRNRLTIKDLYDMLTPLIEKGVDGNLVAYDWYLDDDLMYDEDKKVLFFSVHDSWRKEQEELLEKKKQEEKVKEPTMLQQFIGGFKNRKV